MASTRQTFDALSGNLQESMGVRQTDVCPLLAPAPAKRDLGRRPLRNVCRIAVSRVIPDPNQPRSDFEEAELEGLTLSIRDKGQLCPIRVRWSEEFEKWVIISGERRWRAIQRAGLTEIDCYFEEGDLAPSEVLEQQLIENCQRKDLRPIDEAEAFASLIKFNGLTGKQIAEALHIQPSRVTRALALLKLPEDIQAQVSLGEIPARTAYELSRLTNAKKQAELVELAVAGSLPPEKAARAVRQRLGKAKARARSTRQTFTTEEGWKVVVSAPKKGTYHEIEQALSLALEEVKHRIDSGCQLF
jgi:ParB family chromosome partitioning protein